MFSIVNEIKDNSPPSIIRVIGSSIGLAGSIYIVVSITGYITFGNAIVANIVSMCRFRYSDIKLALLTTSRPYWRCFHYWESCYCYPGVILDSTAGPSMPSVS